MFPPLQALVTRQLPNVVGPLGVGGIPPIRSLASRLVINQFICRPPRHHPGELLAGHHRDRASAVQREPEPCAWRRSIGDAVETGELYSQGFALSDPQAIAEGSPRYQRPKVLITDALCFSAADIFAAGFQDNNLGPVLGTAGHTGAGGANVWTYEVLGLWLDDTLAGLPAGAGFRVALRRATRAGINVGVAIEDLGVAADAVHLPTSRYITERNQDLLAAAANLLAAG